MFLATLPFTAWSMWRGQSAGKSGCRFTPTVFSSTLLYHFTGLLTGTVARNRRWAFLLSIGLVFCLYTVIPQMANFGLVFFKYLTITPVFEESLPDILPASAAAAVRVAERLAPDGEVLQSRFLGDGLHVFFPRRTDPHLHHHALSEMAAG